jgi:hypothetical protein
MGQVRRRQVGSCLDPLPEGLEGRGSLAVTPEQLAPTPEAVRPLSGARLLQRDRDRRRVGDPSRADEDVGQGLAGRGIPGILLQELAEHALGPFALAGVRERQRPEPAGLRARFAAVPHRGLEVRPGPGPPLPRREDLGHPFPGADDLGSPGHDVGEDLFGLREPPGGQVGGAEVDPQPDVLRRGVETATQGLDRARPVAAAHAGRGQGSPGFALRRIDPGGVEEVPLRRRCIPGEEGLIAAPQERPGAARQAGESVGHRIGERDRHSRFERQLLAGLVAPAEIAQGQAQLVMDARPGLELEDRLEVLDRLLALPPGLGRPPEELVGHRRQRRDLDEVRDEALDLLGAAALQLDPSEAQPRRPVVGSALEGALEGDDRPLEIPFVRKRHPEQVGPQEAPGLEAFGIAIADRRGVGHPVTVVELAEIAGRPAQGLPVAPLPGPHDGRPGRPELVPGRALDRRETGRVRKGLQVVGQGLAPCAGQARQEARAGDPPSDPRAGQGHGAPPSSTERAPRATGRPSPGRRVA